MKKKKRLLILGDILGVLVTAVIFLVPFYFMLVQSLKSKAEANKLSISWPSELHFENYIEVFKHGNYQLVTAFKNSGILTLFTVLGLLVTAAMAAYVIQRRRDKIMGGIQALIMLGLMIPAAILPTINLLQTLHIYKTMFSMVMIEIALQTPFAIMLYRGYMASIPRELEEAARIDGAGHFRTMSRIMLPQAMNLGSVIILNSVVGQWNSWLQASIYVPNKRNLWPLQLFIREITANNENFLQSSNPDYSRYLIRYAVIVAATLPIIVLFPFFQDKLEKGVIAGGIKG